MLYNSSLTGIANWPDIFVKGEQVWFGCEPGFYPRDPMVAMCQEGGLWHPDPREMDCHRGMCISREHIRNLEVTRRDSGDNTSSLNLTIVLHCKDGFTPVNDRKAVYSSNGTWVPDHEEFGCHYTTAFVPSEKLHM